MATRRSARDIRFRDVETFLTVVRFGSLHAAARNVGVTASQVSKAVVRLEGCVGARLLTRDAPGALVTAAGRRLIPDFVELVARVSSIDPPGERDEITLAAPAFLTAIFLPRIIVGLPAVSITSIEVPPGVQVAYAGHAVFDVAITDDDAPWPP